MALYIFRKKNILLNARDYSRLKILTEEMRMFTAAAILLTLGATMATLGAVFMIGWIIKKITN